MKIGVREIDTIITLWWRCECGEHFEELQLLRVHESAERHRAAIR